MLKKLHLNVSLLNLRVTVCTLLPKSILTINIRRIFFYIFEFGDALENCEKRLLASSCLCACPSVRIENLCSHNRDFCEIWHLGVPRKPTENIQVLVKPDKNNEYFTWRRYTFIVTSRSVFIRTRKVSDNVVEKSKQAFYDQ